MRTKHLWVVVGEEPAGHPSSGGKSHLAFPKFGCFSNKAGSSCQQQGLPTTSSTSFFFFFSGRKKVPQLFPTLLLQFKPITPCLFFFFSSRDSLFLLWQLGVYLEPGSVHAPQSCSWWNCPSTHLLMLASFSVLTQ